MRVCTARGNVDTVDEPAQPHAAVESSLDEYLALRRLDAGRIFKAEIGLKEHARARQPRRHLLVRGGTVVRQIGEQLNEFWSLFEQPLPLRFEQRRRALDRALGGRVVEQPLEDAVDERAPRRDRARRLRQPVDHAQPVEQRAGHEIAGARGRECPGAWFAEGYLGARFGCDQLHCAQLHGGHEGSVSLAHDTSAAPRLALWTGGAGWGWPYDQEVAAPEHQQPGQRESGPEVPSGPRQRTGRRSSGLQSQLIGRPFGVPIYISPSWLLFVGLITVWFAPSVATEVPGIGSARYLVAATFGVFLGLSVLAHEVAHCVVARRFRIPIERITLSFLAGHSVLAEEPKTPGRASAVAAAGPGRQPRHRGWFVGSAAAIPRGRHRGDPGRGSGVVERGRGRL